MNKARNALTLLIWGEKPITSIQEFKYAMLRAEFALIIILVGFFYIIIDTYNNVKIFLPWYLVMIALSIVAIGFNRVRKYMIANIIVLLMINSLIYLFADVDHPQGGVFFFFMSASMAGLILVSQYNLTAGIIVALIPIALGFIAYLYDTDLMPEPLYSAPMVQFSFLSNFTIGVLSSIFVLQFLQNRNREAEQSLVRQNDLLEKANKELDHFVYSVSHDLRAPLSSIMGLTNIYNLSASQEERMGIIKMIRERTQTLDDFIREVLDYSRNDRTELNMQLVNIKEIVHDVLKGMLHMKGIDHVKFDVCIDEELNVSTDPERLKVILGNLISNTVRYRNPRKESSANISAAMNGKHWSLSVNDNGMGIKTEYLDRIFEMFFKAHDHAHGSGLGLYIVKETLQRLNGEILVESEYGEGSTFTVKLPLGEQLVDES